MNKEKPLIVLTTGGTGGHIFPAEALAGVLLKRGYRVAFITDSRGKNVKSSFTDIYTVSAGGIAGRSVFRLICNLIKLGFGAFQAWWLLRKLKPALVIGFGGYASVPTMMAATSSKILTAVHEQNAVLGRANRLFAYHAKLIFTSFNKVKFIPPNCKAIYTGMPVRTAIADLSTLPYPSFDNKTNILVLGGSQGARIFSEVIPKAMSLLDEDLQKRISISQQCRLEDINKVENLYIDTYIKTDLSSFFSDIPDRLKNAHLVISRSGASSVAEISTSGRPAILVPLPSSVDDHQKANAVSLDEAGGGWLIEQKDFTPENLSKKLTELLTSPDELSKAADYSLNSGEPHAAERLADEVIKLIETTGN